MKDAKDITCDAKQPTRRDDVVIPATPIRRAPRPPDDGVTSYRPLRLGRQSANSYESRLLLLLLLFLVLRRLLLLLLLSP